jgi:iron complex outermembrane recepter protein
MKDMVPHLEIAAFVGLCMLPSGPHVAFAQSADQSAGGLEEIIVTAQREAQELLRTPVALTALTGADLSKQGISSTLELSGMVPGLSIDRGQEMNITIRGVTNTDDSEKGDPSAAFMMDGIYIARVQAQDVSFFDVNRVEVLRGPQGTLWGRNTTAGLVHVISNLPEHKDAAAFNLSYGNYDTVLADGMVNVDTGERSAVRAAFAFDKRNDYYRSSVPTTYGFDPLRNNFSMRLTGLFDPTDSIKLTVRGDYSSIQGSPTSVGNLPSKAYDLTDPNNPVRKDVSADQLLTRDFPTPFPNRQNTSTWGVGAELNWDLGPVALSYLGSYRELRQFEDQTLQLFGFLMPRSINFGNYWQNSQEVRIATTGDGPFKIQGGLYYFKERSSIGFYLFNLQGQSPTFGFPEDPTISESYAAFSQATYSFTPAIRLTAGVRYTHDDKSRDGATVNNQSEGDLSAHFVPGVDCNAQAGQPGAPPSGVNYACLDWAHRQYAKTTWRTGIEGDVTPDTLLYGSVATGYKAGGFGDGCEAGSVDPHGVACNQARDAASLYYNPESLTAYEVGLKGKLGGIFRYSSDLFYYDYTNIQLTGLGNVSGGPSLVTKNAGKASIKGLEFEGSIKLSPNQRLDGSATWTDAKYDEYLAFINTTDFINYKGRPLDRAPKTTESLTYVYRQPTGNNGNVEFRVNGRYSASYVVSDYSAPAQYKQPSFFKADASLTYSGAGDKWHVRVYGRNLTNQVLLSAVDSFANIWVTDPRTYGIGTGLNF